MVAFITSHPGQTFAIGTAAAPAPEKEAATLIATAALSAIVVTMSRTDDGRRSWILTKGVRTLEVTTLDDLRDAIVQMRGA
jgi:hypothetical protein